MKKIFFEPFSHQNDFVDINKIALSELGFNPTKLSLLNIISTLGSRAPLIMSWVEDQPYRSTATRFRAFLITLKFSLLIVLSPIFSSNRIWIRHNFKPHNAKGNLFYYKLLCNLFKLFKFKEVFLEQYMGSNFIPHPLYIDDVAAESRKYITPNTKPTHFNILFFGAIKKYKPIDQLLRIWPKELAIEIKGRCTDKDYEQEISKIIRERKLNARWDNKFLSNNELDSALSDADFVILPHEDNSMISSGTFYHALSFGCNIIANHSQFAVDKAQCHDFVSISNFSELNHNLLSQIFRPKKIVLNDALEHYSRTKLKLRWAALLN